MRSFFLSLYQEIRSFGVLFFVVCIVLIASQLVAGILLPTRIQLPTSTIEYTVELNEFHCSSNEYLHYKVSAEPIVETAVDRAIVSIIKIGEIDQQTGEKQPDVVVAKWLFDGLEHGSYALRNAGRNLQETPVNLPLLNKLEPGRYEFGFGVRVWDTRSSLVFHEFEVIDCEE